jgi:hypothetical protein
MRLERAVMATGPMASCLLPMDHTVQHWAGDPHSKTVRRRAVRIETQTDSIPGAAWRKHIPLHVSEELDVFQRAQDREKV